MGSLEQSLARTEADAEATLKAATVVVSSVKKFRDAAKKGNLRELHKTLESAEQAIAALRQQFSNAEAGWDFDEETYFSGMAFHAEMVEAARQAGVKIFEQHGIIYCYPFLIRVRPQDQTVLINKIKERRLRPSVLAGHLKELQNRPVRFKSEIFLESIFIAYKNLLAHQSEAFGKPKKLMDIYELLTLLPGQSKEYSQEEFARDIYLLEKSGVTATRKGLVWRLFPPSRARGLRLITEEGMERYYYTISFERP
jgi:hypothetical protein